MKRKKLSHKRQFLNCKFIDAILNTQFFGRCGERQTLYERGGTQTRRRGGTMISFPTPPFPSAVYQNQTGKLGNN